MAATAVEKPFTLDLPSLQRDFEQVELAAVCQCSGNRRGLSDPHVAGVEWGIGAMGNARWKGVRLKDVLARAVPKKEALEVVFNGADHGSLEATPDFMKSIPVWKAIDENTLLAWQMNGAPLPHWNGAPVRLVVPGWTATYWMKHLISIQVVSQPFKNFWMSTAYRIPKGKFPVVDRFLSQETDVNTPITDIVVNSLLTSPREGQQVPLRCSQVEVKGIAWDNGSGIRTVEVSADGGQTLADRHARPGRRALLVSRLPPRVQGRLRGGDDGARQGHQPDGCLAGLRADLQPGRLPQQRRLPGHGPGRIGARR